MIALAAQPQGVAPGPTPTAGAGRSAAADFGTAWQAAKEPASPVAPTAMGASLLPLPQAGAGGSMVDQMVAATSAAAQLLGLAPVTPAKGAGEVGQAVPPSIGPAGNDQDLAQLQAMIAAMTGGKPSAAPAVVAAAVPVQAPPVAKADAPTSTGALAGKAAETEAGEAVGSEGAELTPASDPATLLRSVKSGDGEPEAAKPDAPTSESMEGRVPTQARPLAPTPPPKQSDAITSPVFAMPAGKAPVPAADAAATGAPAEPVASTAEVTVNPGGPSVVEKPRLTGANPVKAPAPLTSPVPAQEAEQASNSVPVPADRDGPDPAKADGVANLPGPGTIVPSIGPAPVAQAAASALPTSQAVKADARAVPANAGPLQKPVAGRRNDRPVPASAVRNPGVTGSSAKTDASALVIPPASPVVDQTAAAPDPATLQMLVAATNSSAPVPTQVASSAASAKAATTTNAKAPVATDKRESDSRIGDPRAMPDLPPTTDAPAVAFADAHRAAAALMADAVQPKVAQAGAAGPASAAPVPADVGVTHQLDLAQSGAWLDQLTKDITRAADSNGQLRFSLAPERLGRLDVALASGSDGTAIRFVTQTREAHRLVSDAQPQLVAEARAQGLRVSETHVDLNNGSAGGSAHQSFGNQNSGGGAHPQRPRWEAEPSAPAPAPAPSPSVGDNELYA